jgi:hypothetical protein
MKFSLYRVLMFLVVGLGGFGSSVAQEKSAGVTKATQPEDGFKALFDGKTFDGWEGDTKSTWRIEDQALTAGSLEVTVPRNDFLATTKEYADFELRFQYKLRGTEGFVNGGVQFRTKRIPNHHEVSGYQADLGAGFDGHLYDESRRNKVLAGPSKEVLEKCLKKDGWNEYRVLAEGPRIRMWLNDTLTVDYTEEDPAIARTGIIAVQVHGDGKTIVQYKDLQIREIKL